MTVIGVEQIEREAKMNLIDSITSLPSVGVSATPDNSRNSGDLSQGDAARAVVQRLDLVRGSHDLGRTPGLVDAQVGDDVGGVEASDRRRSGPSGAAEVCVE